ncbi:hypothetical protein E1I69_06650 [Bacillus timonensis]|uniref:Citrate transporter-like domain-containing protein n=1 Tax=Bacillus timonensis TaxID=1033734 RepID=A0A4S3PV67_9BACI|nr:hypothetical protein [Bacillus timonensis]THE13588.1 hypothetical protein E1I69_06650 [Bacillus timonensis]
MKQHPLVRYLYLFYAFVFLLQTINVFIDSETINYILGVLSIIMLIVSFPLASGLFKILGGTFLAIGGYLFFATGQSLHVIPSLLTSNLSLLTLLAMLPWMNSIVRSGRFDRNLNLLMKVNVSDLGKLYPRSSLTTHILAAFLNLSAATISHDVLKSTLSSFSKEIRNSFITTASLRGYSLALLWSPLEIMVAVSIFATGVDYVTLLPWLILMAVTAYLLDSIFGRIYYKKYKFEQSSLTKQSMIDKKGIGKKMMQFIIALVLFLTLVIMIGNLVDLSFILTVTILIFPFSFVWSLMMKRRRSFWIIGWNNWKEKTNMMQNFIVLFISLSLFSTSLGDTAFLEAIQKPLSYVSEYPIVILFLIQVIFVFLSMFGIHPIATVGILTGIITPLLDILNPVSIALVLITGSVATFTVGTYGLLVTLTAMGTGQSPYRITVQNIPFAIGMWVLGTLVAYFLL